NGLQTRDFVFVGDVVATLLKSMEYVQSGSVVFNVCTGRQTSILNLAHEIGKLCGFEPKIRFLPARIGEIVHSCGDRTSLARELQLPDPTEIRSGLAETLAWIKKSAVRKGQHVRCANLAHDRVG